MIFGVFAVLHAFLIYSLARADSKLPIVFVYTVVPAVCKHGLPEYIRTSVEQAIFSQPDAQVIMASNYAECNEIEQTVDKVQNLIKIDMTSIASERTLQFTNSSKSIFASDYGGELWLTSATRFFALEDIMKNYGYTEILHVEADNMLYGNITSILDILRKHYPLTATPLTANKSMITASVFWVSSLYSLTLFNDYLLKMVQNTDNIYQEYLWWLRRYACCRKGGIDPDAHGNGIKPFAINEMTMLANYHRIQPDQLPLLPVAPAYDGYIQRRPFCNVSQFAPGGKDVGPSTGHGVWDPNSWGQNIGGTSLKKGRDRGFIDSSHIAGQGIILGKCTVAVLCGNQTVSPYGFKPEKLSERLTNTSLPMGSGSQLLALAVPPQKRLRLRRHRTLFDEVGAIVANNAKAIDDGDGNGVESSGGTGSSSNSAGGRGCYTAPFVRCGEDSPWTPLWNLHVHSKHTLDYRSVPCFCPGT